MHELKDIEPVAARFDEIGTSLAALQDSGVLGADPPLSVAHLRGKVDRARLLDFPIRRHICIRKSALDLEAGSMCCSGHKDEEPK